MAGRRQKPAGRGHRYLGQSRTEQRRDARHPRRVRLTLYISAKRGEGSEPHFRCHQPGRNRPPRGFPPGLDVYHRPEGCEGLRRRAFRSKTGEWELGGRCPYRRRYALRPRRERHRPGGFQPCNLRLLGGPHDSDAARASLQPNLLVEAERGKTLLLDYLRDG